MIPGSITVQVGVTDPPFGGVLVNTPALFGSVEVTELDTPFGGVQVLTSDGMARQISIQAAEADTPFGGVQVFNPEGVTQIDFLTGGGGGGGDSSGQPGGAVTSVFGRTGDVTAQASDYAAFYAPIGMTAAGHVTGEVPTGTIDGFNAVFSTSVPFASGSLAVYLNGLRQRIGIDYTISGLNSFTMHTAPMSGDLLTVDYLQ